MPIAYTDAAMTLGKTGPILCSLSQASSHAAPRPRHVFFESGLAASASHESDPRHDHAIDGTDESTWATKKRRYYGESMYVELFQEMVCTVLEKESHLFTASEQTCLSSFFSLEYDARYLFVRLLQRKRDQWYRLGKLGYEADVGDMAQAAHDLCRPFAAPSTSQESAPPEFAYASTCELYRFAMMDTEMDGGLPARLSLLTVDELRLVAKRLGRKPQGTRAELTARLLAKPSNATLFAQGRELRMTMSATQERLEAAITMIMQGGCIQLIPSVVLLMERLALVYYRGKPALGTMLTAAVLHRTHKRHFPVYTYQRTPDLFASREALLRYECALQAAEQMDDLVDELRARPAAAREGVQLWEAWHAQWVNALSDVAQQYPHGVPRATYPRLRFHAGWPLTRVMFKACECFARLGERERERHVLTQLLAQRSFWRGRRGAWHERLALVTAQCQNAAAALTCCHAALADPDTHMVYQSSLERRIARLESRLRVPKDERHQPRSKLHAPTVDLLTATRLDTPARRGALRTMWRGAQNEDCTVEELCLAQYAQQGYVGYHCEGQLVHFVCVLLLWDVLFTPIAGAFEMPYQRGPLDWATDLFYTARRDAIEAQLTDIATTGGLGILDAVDARERPRQTYAVGCRWDEYPRETLRHFAECLGGPALATLCRVLCQGDGLTMAGFPDLSLWRYPDKQVCFVEVKSPNDRLSEVQRVWIDILHRAGLRVHVARVQAETMPA